MNPASSFSPISPGMLRAHSDRSLLADALLRPQVSAPIQPPGGFQPAFAAPSSWPAQPCHTEGALSSWPAQPCHTGAASPTTETARGLTDRELADAYEDVRISVFSSGASLIDTYTGDAVYATFVQVLLRSPTFVQLYRARKQSSDFRLSDITYTNHFLRYTLDNRTTRHTVFDPNDSQPAEARGNALASSFSTVRDERKHHYINIGAAPEAYTTTYENWQAHLIGEVVSLLAPAMRDADLQPTQQFAETMRAVKREMCFAIYRSDNRIDCIAQRQIKARTSTMLEVGLANARGRHAFNTNEFRRKLASVTASLAPYFPRPQQVTAEEPLPALRIGATHDAMPPAPSAPSAPSLPCQHETPVMHTLPTNESDVLADGMNDVPQEPTVDEWAAIEQWLDTLPARWA